MDELIARVTDALREQADDNWRVSGQTRLVNNLTYGCDLIVEVNITRFPADRQWGCDPVIRMIGCFRTEDQAKHAGEYLSQAANIVARLVERNMRSDSD